MKYRVGKAGAGTFLGINVHCDSVASQPVECSLFFRGFVLNRLVGGSLGECGQWRTTDRTLARSRPSKSAALTKKKRGLVVIDYLVRDGVTRRQARDRDGRVALVNHIEDLDGRLPCAFGGDRMFENFQVVLAMQDPAIGEVWHEVLVVINQIRLEGRDQTESRHRSECRQLLVDEIEVGSFGADRKICDKMSVRGSGDEAVESV